ncbi:MAG: hypothetical protein K6C94_00390, partial [Candidatus Gastranaerophilales bacterium]|nr:hypothetical protein [Candidatus Gastranaerophilales bacterium]
MIFSKIIKRFFAFQSQYWQYILFRTHSFFFSFEEKKKERVSQEKSGFCVGRSPNKQKAPVHCLDLFAINGVTVLLLASPSASAHRSLHCVAVHFAFCLFGLR